MEEGHLNLAEFFFKNSVAGQLHLWIRSKENLLRIKVQVLLKQSKVPSINYRQIIAAVKFLTLTMLGFAMYGSYFSCLCIRQLEYVVLWNSEKLFSNLKKLPNSLVFKFQINGHNGPFLTK